MSGDKDFLSRWSARKTEAREPAEPPAPNETPPDAPAAFTPEELETLTDAELCEKLDLPDPATLKEGDDFKAFLESRVPERLRRAALRRLWRSNPIFSRLDGLDDYDEDFRAAAASGGAVKTLYEVGRGFARPENPEVPHAAMDVAPDDALETAVPENAAVQDSCGVECDSQTPDAETRESGGDDSRVESPPTEAETGCVRPPQITSRRMSFRFVEKSNKRR